MTTLTQPIAANVFPAKVELADGTVHSALRVLLAAAGKGEPARLVAYADERDEHNQLRAVLALNIPISLMTPDPDRAYGWVVTDAAGAEIRVTKEGGCGCRSALKHQRPPYEL